MPKKENKPKKKSIEELRMILDNISVKDLNHKDEKYLKALGKRMKESKKEVTYQQIDSIKREISGETVDPLKPTVIIHPRKIKKPELFEFSEVEGKEETTEENKFEGDVPEFIEVRQKEIKPNIEKIEKTTPSFIPIEKKEKSETEIEEEITKDDSEQEETKGLPEWEPVVDEIQLTESEQKEEPAIDEKEPVETNNQEEDVGYKIEAFKELESIDYDTSIMLYDSGFLSIDDLKLASVNDLIQTGRIKKRVAKKIRKEIDEKEQVRMLKPVIDEDTKDKTLEIDDKEEKRQGIDTETKLEVFKDLESINNETAVLLYNNHITSIEELKNVTLKELIRIQGIKKKVAREIIKELDEKEEENLKVKPIKLGESAEGEVTEDQIEGDEEVKDEEVIPSPVELKSRSAEWLPTEEGEKDLKKEISEDEAFLEQDIEEGIPDLDIGKEKKIAAFEGIKTIDDKTAVLLHDNGFTTEDSLRMASVKDLTHVNGIKKKVAKRIKKELDEKMDLGPIAKENGVDSLSNDVKDVFDEEFHGSDEDESFGLDEKILEYEPSPKVEDFFGEEDKEEEELLIADETVDVFKDVKSIDEKTAKLLVENKIMSIGDIMDKTIKDLTKIRGIKKKLAKEIKREISIIVEMSEDPGSFSRDENPFIDEEVGDWDSVEEANGYKHKGFTLYEKEIKIKGGKKRKVRFFSKDIPDEGEPIDLPDGYEAEVNKKTGVPHLRKKK